jgi:2-amino-4-hydroxy-6-hydroxymethyldihydropteridine diphosphokinase
LPLEEQSFSSCLCAFVSEYILWRKSLSEKDSIVLTGLKVRCIIGIFDWERKRKQDVLLNLKFPVDIRKAASRDDIRDAVDYKKISKAAIAFVEKSDYQLVETLADRLADALLSRFQLEEINLSVSKPGAIRGSQNVGVEITRKRAFPAEGLVYFSLGSNIEPKTHLGNALSAIESQYRSITVSRVYETSPVGGGKNQPYFWNLVLGVDTGDGPEKIRRWIGNLEKQAGRARTKDRYASRTLDVDLILWKNRVAKSKAFTLPHPDILTKAFVLFPLLEIAPTLILPDSGKPLMELANQFRDKTQTIRQLREAL